MITTLAFAGPAGGSELFLILFIVIPTLFWIWSIVDCATKEPSEGNDKLIWILVIVLLGWIGSLIYCLARRPTRVKLHGQ